MGMAILITIAPLIGGAIIGLLSALVSPLLFLLIIPFGTVALIITIKIVFYFPSKATGNNITLRQSFKMPPGYVWKIIVANFYVCWRLSLVAFAYLITGIIVLAGIGFAAESLGLEIEMIATIGGVAFMIPFVFFFSPLFTILGVTVLSNYYQYTMQNDISPAESTVNQ